MNTKKGDIVARISYGKDIIFSVEKVIKINEKKGFAILRGITQRIEADSPLDDLVTIDKSQVLKKMQVFDKKINCIKSNRIKEAQNLIIRHRIS